MAPKSRPLEYVGSSRDFPGYDKRTTIEALASIVRRATRLLPKLRHANIIRTFAGLRPFSEDDQLEIDRVDEIEGLILATGSHEPSAQESSMTLTLRSHAFASRRHAIAAGLDTNPEFSGSTSQSG